MIVITALKQEEKLEQKAIKVSKELHAPLISRRKKSLSRLMQEHPNEDLMIVGQDRLLYYPVSEEGPVFFHPNVAMLRYKRLRQGKEDPLIVASQLEEGMSFLDCTLGLGADSMIASMVVGVSGKVVGIEANPVLAYIVKQGLQDEDLGEDPWLSALKRIEVRHANHLTVLKELENDSFDVVYFDPMFEHSIDESTGIKPLKSIAHYESLTSDVIKEALRVAKGRVVLKDHYLSKRFDKFGFHVIKRKTSLFHFGFKEKR